MWSMRSGCMWSSTWSRMSFLISPSFLHKGSILLYTIQQCFFFLNLPKHPLLFRVFSCFFLNYSHTSGYKVLPHFAFNFIHLLLIFFTFFSLQPHNFPFLIGIWPFHLVIKFVGYSLIILFILVMLVQCTFIFYFSDLSLHSFFFACLSKDLSILWIFSRK